MFFSTSMTLSVSEGDRGLLYYTSLIMGCLEKSAHEITTSNKHVDWRFPTINCHSVARLVSTFSKELKLIDGFVYGVSQRENGEFILQKTRHSWLKTTDEAIIDPWPMGVVSPGNALLVPTQKNVYNIHGSNLYKEDKLAREGFSVRKSWDTAFALKRILRQHASSAEKVDEVSALIQDLF